MSTLALAHRSMWIDPDDTHAGCVAMRRTDAEILIRERVYAEYWAGRDAQGLYVCFVRDFLMLRDMFRGVTPRNRRGSGHGAMIRELPWRGADA